MRIIDYKQAFAVCRTDPEAAAQILCDLAREMDQLNAAVATLRIMPSIWTNYQIAKILLIL